MAELKNLIRSQVKAGRDDIERSLFCGKDGFRAVQAADVFAYETCKRIGEKSKEPDKDTNKPMRKSVETITCFGHEKGERHRWTMLCEREKLAFLGRLLPNP